MSNREGLQQTLTDYDICRGSSFALNGCINDALCVRHLLKTRFGFQDADIMLLTDDQSDPQKWPTRANMIYQMQMLVWDLRPGDSLFFHFSGEHLADTHDLRMLNIEEAFWKTATFPRLTVMSRQKAGLICR
jgi:hypothetical protein